MIKVSATKFRQNLFEYLDKVSSGKTILIERNHEEVARILPIKKLDWRKKMSIQVQINASPEELIETFEEWEEYI